MEISKSRFFSGDNLRMATLLFLLLGAMWALNTRLENRLTQQINSLESRITQRIDRLEDNMNGRFEKIETRLDSFGERIAKNEARLNAQ